MGGDDSGTGGEWGGKHRKVAQMEDDYEDKGQGEDGRKGESESEGESAIEVKPRLGLGLG